MKRVVLNESIRHEWGSLAGPIAIDDQNGCVLGHFIPGITDNAAEYAWARSQFSAEEAELSGQQTGGISTAELVKRLNAL